MFTAASSAAAVMALSRRSYASLGGAANAVRIGEESKELTDCCAPIRDALPADGASVSAADFAALVEEHLPNRAYNALGLYTIREVAEACPSMFRLDPDAETGWYTVARSDVSPMDSGASPVSGGGKKDPSKYVAVKGPGLVPLQEALTAEADGVPIDAVLRYLHTNTSYKVRTMVTIRPKAREHGAHVFVDGDSIGKETAAQLFSVLKLTKVASTRTIVRQPTTSPHDANDLVCRAPAQTFQLLENQLGQLTAGSAAVLKPIVIMCGEEQKPLYAAMARNFGTRMDITLCTPSSVGHVA